MLIVPLLWVALLASDSTSEASALLARGRFQEAAQISLAALRSAPDDIALLDIAGQSLVGLGRQAEAIPLLQHELAIAPMNLRATRALASAYLAVNDFPNGHKLFDQLTASDPADPMNWYQLGLLLYRNGYYSGAIDAVGRALASANPLPPTEQNRARIVEAISLIETGRYAQGERAVGDALADSRNSANLDLLLSSVRVFYETNRLAEALKQADRAAAVNPANAAAHLWRARILQRSNDLTAALREAERARDLAPDSPAPRSLLVRLYLKLDRPADSAREAEWLRIREAQ